MKTILKDTSKLTFMGVMLALTILFVVATVIPNLAISIAVVIFLPTILTGIVLGPVSGGFIGFCAGLATLLRALLLPMSPFDVFFINPLVSILPRIFIGIVAYYSFILVQKVIHNNIISSSIAGGVGMITNTFLVVGMLYIVFGQTMVDAMEGMAFLSALGFLFTTNGVIEMITAIIIVPVVYGAYLRYSKMR
ncbi:MAG: ECF transporter S component [Eubacteriales bacterium]